MSKNNDPSKYWNHVINSIEFDLTEKQNSILKNTYDSKISFLNGPAGTSKTFISFLCGLKLLFKEEANKILYVRSAIESGKTLGAMPGEMNEKIGYYTKPLEDKIQELLHKSNIGHNQVNSIKSKIERVPINFMRGMNLKDTFIIVDECQNLTREQILLIMSRITDDSKMFLIGDSKQSDISNSGWNFTLKLFNNEDSKNKNIHVYEFNNDDIVRSEIVKFIIKTFDTSQKIISPKNKHLAYQLSAV